MKDYCPTNAVFSNVIPIVEEEDPVNADNDNAAAKQLIQNDIVLMKTKVDKIEGQGLVTSEERKAWNETYQQSTGYTDQKIADLINGAPSTLDTLGEIAQAMQDNYDVVEALDAAIGSKVSRIEVESYLGEMNKQLGGLSFTSCTQAEYDALEAKDPATLYIIVEG